MQRPCAEAAPAPLCAPSASHNLGAPSRRPVWRLRANLSGRLRRATGGPPALSRAMAKPTIIIPPGPAGEAQAAADRPSDRETTLSQHPGPHSAAGASTHAPRRPSLETRVLLRLGPRGSLHEAAEAILATLAAERDRHATSLSGVVRIEVPLPSSFTALTWLQGQARCCADEPRVYFSPRRHATPGGVGTHAAEHATSGVLALAGVGAAWCWRGGAGVPFGPAQHSALSRLLSPAMPSLRAFGGMRFSSARPQAPEWEAFGAFLFLLPRLELVEGATSAALCCNVVWDAGAGQDLTWEEGAWGSMGSCVTAREAFDAAAAAARALGTPQLVSPGVRVTSRASSHVPDLQAWSGLMEPLHSTLQPASCALHSPAPASSSPSCEAGSLTKVVLARRTDVRVRGDVDPLALLSALEDKDPRAYQVLLQLPTGEAFLGAPPERLYVRTHGAVASEAVAGTRPRGPVGDEAEDARLAEELLSSPKENTEFTVVREWVQEALGSVCDDVMVELPKALLRQQSIQHLYGRLSGRLRPGMTDADIIRALHPTPAVCGQPQDKAMALLDESEHFDRGWYSGPFGWVSGIGAEFVVAIRSALIQGPAAGAAGSAKSATAGGEAGVVGGDDRDGRVVALYAGVGIVRGADVLAEWNELELKTQALNALLTPQPPITTEPTLNAMWARLLVDELCRLGVTTFCVAPGSRSSPLSIAAAAHPRARVVTCIDERSLGFYAVGFAKGRSRPAAVITSSGTAVANLLPAVVEASQSHTPVVVLTADRPAELRDTGANQTIDQVRMFGSYTRCFADVPPPSADIPARSVLTTASMAVRRALGPSPGPVHLNLQFREPLAPVETPGQDAWPARVLEGLDRWMRSPAPFTTPVLPPAAPSAAGPRSRALDDLLADLASARRGLVVASGLSDAEEVAAAARLAAALGWPLAADATSGLRVAGRGGRSAALVLHHLDHALLAGEDAWHAMRPDVVLDVGCHLVSKRVAQFLEWATLRQWQGRRAGEGSERPTQWVRVFPHLSRHDPSHAVSHAAEMRCATLAELAEAAARGREPGVAVEQARYTAAMLALDDVVAAAVREGMEAAEEAAGGAVIEPRVARAVATRLPPGWGLFLGNSMPIRDMDMYAWAPRDDSATSPGASLTASGPGVPVAANRGASGIDGVLSTAVGYAQGLGRGVTLVVGDVSALHDTNGLALLQEARGRPPVVVVLVNNGGGAIFSFLPVAGAIPRDVFETVFATPPNTRFADLLKAHGVAHRLVAHADALPAVLDEAWSLGAHCVVEVLTDRESNLDIHRAIQDRARATARAACAHLFPPHAPATHSLVPTALPLAVGPAPGLAGTMAGGMGIGTSLGQLRLRCLRYSVPLARPVTTGAKDSQRTGVLIECTIGDAEHSTGAGAGGNADVGGRGVEGLASKAGPHWNGSSKAGAATAAVDGGKPTLSGAATAAGLGEVSPLPGLHQETWAEAAAQSELVCRLLDGKHLPASAVLSLHGPLRWVEDASGVRVADLAPSVRCGLEAALLTAAANRLGTTVAALLGAAAGVSGVQGYEDVRVNGLVSEADPDKAAQAALDLAERGFQCIKVKVGRGDVASDVAAVHAVRAAVPAGVALRADANRAWGRDEAEAFMRGVADVGLEYLEEPTQDPELTQGLARDTGVPVALDETVDGAVRDAERDASAGRSGSGAEGPWGSGASRAPSTASAAKELARHAPSALVLKPSVLGGLHAAMDVALRTKRLSAAPVRAVVSAAFETSVGLAAYAALAQVLDRAAGAEGAGAAHGLATGAWLGGDVVAERLAVVEDEGKMRGSDVARILREGPTALRGRAEGDRAGSGSATGLLGAAGLHEVVRETRVRLSVHMADGLCRIGGVRVRPAHQASQRLRPVLLLHGFMGSSSDMLPIARALGSTRHVVALDLPGHGDSSWEPTQRAGSLNEAAPLPAETPTVEQTAAAVAAAIRALDLHDPILVGYSLGARVALHVADASANQDAPKLGGVLCVSGSPGIEQASERAARLEVDGALADQMRRNGLEAFAHTWYQSPMWGDLRAHPRFPEMVALRTRGSQEALAAALQSLSVGRQRSLWPSLPAMARTAPVVFVAGSRDDKYVAMVRRAAGEGQTAFAKTQAEARALAAAAGDAGVTGVIVEGSGHALHWERPEVVVGLIEGMRGGK